MEDFAASAPAKWDVTCLQELVPTHARSPAVERQLDTLTRDGRSGTGNRAGAPRSSRFAEAGALRCHCPDPLACMGPRRVWMSP